MLTRVSVFSSCAMIAIAGAQASAQLQSTFDVDAEGWVIYNDGFNLTHSVAGGNPGGFISAFDDPTGIYWGFEAPASYHGNLSAYFGGTLSWDLRPFSGVNSPNTLPDVFLEGAGITLTNNTAPQPINNQWNACSLKLDATGGWLKATGGAPTDAEIQAVLANVTLLRIRGEYFSGGIADQTGLDNVRLQGSDACYADCDGDGFLSIDDFICFQTLFALGDPLADCDGDGFLSIDDFICYQTLFAIGC